MSLGGDIRQNLRAALHGISRRPGLTFPAVSRIYFATLQATAAMLHANAGNGIEHDGDVWRAAEREREGLGAALWRLYRWCRRADYATGDIDVQHARRLVDEHAAICRSLGIHEE